MSSSSDKTFDEYFTATRAAIAAKRADKGQGTKEIMFGCLCSPQEPAQADAGPNLCANVHDDCEKIEMMIDSGAGEKVASQDKFPTYPMIETTASGTTYSSAAEKEAEHIVNMGQKYV